jgi:CRISPR system Cascade subunit CasD
VAVLLIRLEGPMQAWGTQSKFRYRDTGLEPSKSGVIGLLCAALGRPRHSSLGDLSALRMGVRVDRPGSLKLDYQTVGAEYIGGRLPALAMHGETRKQSGIISRRYYLSDASFLVGLEGSPPLLAELNTALARPVWSLCLGRKAFPPGAPVRLPDSPPVGPGIRNETLEHVLASYPLLEENGESRVAEPRVRIVIDAPAGESPEVRTDVPISFANRTFTSRSVRTYWQEIER